MATNSKQVEVFIVTIDPAAVAADTTAEQLFTVPGCRVGDAVLVTKNTHTPGLGICGSRVSGNDQVGITFVNPTAAPIDPASEPYRFVVIRR